MTVSAPKRGKQNGYNSTVLHAKRELRRSDAEYRQNLHSSLTTKEKIQKAKSRPGESKKELKRLNELLANEKPVTKAPVVKTEKPKPTRNLRGAELRGGPRIVGWRG